jgi:hypothetical protein
MGAQNSALHRPRLNWEATSRNEKAPKAPGSRTCSNCTETTNWAPALPTGPTDANP